MVALPLIDPRQSTNQHNTAISTSTKLVPRKGYTDSWYDEMGDILAARKLTAVANEPKPPTIPEIAAQLDGVPTNIIEAVHAAITYKWWQEATALYHIVRSSIDLSGIYEKKDLAMIKANYQMNDFRNGPAFLKWAMGFTDKESLGTQSQLLTKLLNTKLAATATQEQFGQHVSNLLIDWLAVTGNTEHHPAGFYHTLFNSMPNVDQGKMAHLRSWLSDRISDNLRFILRRTPLGNSACACLHQSKLQRHRRFPLRR